MRSDTILMLVLAGVEMKTRRWEVASLLLEAEKEAQGRRRAEWRASRVVRRREDGMGDILFL